MSRRNDADSLRDMLDAAKEAASFVRGKGRMDLDKDRKLVLAIVHLVEIIGEAAGVDLDRVWDTVQDDLPPLIAQLEKSIPAGK